MRNLIVVFGDQLNRDASAFDGFDSTCDAVLMAEIDDEATHVWCHKRRIALFFSAMRHFRDELLADRVEVHYHALTRHDSHESGKDFARTFDTAVRELRPSALIATMPGDYRALSAIQDAAARTKIALDVRPDKHFFCGIDEFQAYAGDKKRLVMEDFYRTMRKRYNVLLSDSGEPEGGAWNFDKENRKTFGRMGPANMEPPLKFALDGTTEEVIELVQQRYADHPGSLEDFDLPVNRQQATAMLEHFIESSLPHFGAFEDAMWTGEPFLYHSRLSSSLNMHLLSARECVAAAVDAYRRGAAPINSVEGYVRQILGWREFTHGIYWRHMPQYVHLNHFKCEMDVPSFYWDGETDMRCMRETMQHILRHGYAHHIQRLMVVGLFAMLLGVEPRKFHDWHLAMYLDAIDWVSLPNALGMSQYGDGGIVGTKPYCASGNYINKMSNYCGGCRYDFRKAVGEDACPYTTLYWDFLDRHQVEFRRNPRMGMQIKNLERRLKDEGEMAAIRTRATELREAVRNGTTLK